MMVSRRIASCFILFAGVTGVICAQDAPTHRGRKYRIPPDTSHIEVEVLRSYNGKPVANAAVIFHSVKDGKDEGNMEVKTNEDGKALIDIIPTGSAVDVQVIADGFATYAETYQVNEPSRTIEVKMLRPRAQISTYEDNSGKAAANQPGTQEAAKPHSAPVVEPPKPTNHTSDQHPLAPVDPNATPGNSQNPTPKPQ